MNENRADSFLRLIRRSQRGRLKIYVGYCAGVGKTYQMLLEGGRLKEDGIDVVVGLVETHGRKETEALLQGLEVLPRRRTTYRGIDIEEMDLDAVLARRPAAVLVDELAHTNVPGSRNPKRYEDVEEVLAAGIHVISTLNIQHLESLYETVERVTGVKVRERIPDRIVAEADQLVNVDVTTEDLRRRLEEGKVYTRERVETALNHFFSAGNLEQLRELTLRELAAQIDSRRREPLAEEAASSLDQVMVCLSSKGPNSEALLRYASRLAGRLNRNWYAVYVQTARENPTVIDAETQRMLSRTLTLAQELGATVFTYKGDDVARTLLQFAREYRVSHIVIGTPGGKIPFWRRTFGATGIAERLIREGAGETIVVLNTRRLEAETKRAERSGAPGSLPAAGADAAGAQGGVVVSENAAVPSVRPVAGTPGGPRGPERPERMNLPGPPGFLWTEPVDKWTAIADLLRACCREWPGVNYETAWNSVVEREKQGGTFVGEDVVLPHARLAGLGRPVLAVGVARQGIQDRPEGRSARIMIVALSEAEKPDGHVSLLSTIARMAREDAWRKDLLAARDAGEVSAIVREWVAHR